MSSSYPADEGCVDIRAAETNQEVISPKRSVVNRNVGAEAWMDCVKVCTPSETTKDTGLTACVVNGSSGEARSIVTVKKSLVLNVPVAAVNRLPGLVQYVSPSARQGHSG